MTDDSMIHANFHEAFSLSTFSNVHFLLIVWKKEPVTLIDSFAIFHRGVPIEKANYYAAQTAQT